MISQPGPFCGVYRDRRIIVTGHTGFKGSWLALWLAELGAEVHGYALAPPTTPSHFDLCRLNLLVHSRIGDIRDYDRLRRAFVEVRPEIVFHLAAQPLVRESYRTPRETMDANIGGTVNVLECVRNEPSVRAVVIITSDKCYENHEWDYGYREADAMGGHDPYSASKGCAELVTAAYRRSFFSVDRRSSVAVATARAGNVLGGGDWAEDRLVPDCVRALVAGRPVVLRNPDAVRPWQHVLEPLSGYLQLGSGLVLDPKGSDGAWNFGPVDADVLTTRQVVEAFLAEWGEGSIEVARERNAPHEAGMLKLSCEKAVARLRWRPVLSLRQAVDWTVAWYGQWARHAASEALLARSRAQISEYTALARTLGLAWAQEIHGGGK